MRIRNVWLGGVAAAAIVGLVASCGGGGGGGGDAGGGVTYTVGGTLTGVVEPVVLRLNGGNAMTQLTSGSFVFPAGIAAGASYAVTADGAQNCNVSNGSGTMGGTDLTSVQITCTTVVRSASINAAQESPPTTSTATGRGAVIVDPTSKAINGGISFTGLTATGQHIHRGDGTIVVGLILSPDGNAATVPAGTLLNAGDYAELLAGSLYFNVHTVANPGGEIRGPISLRGGIVAGLATLDGAHEVPANASTATGRAMVVVDSTTREVLTAYVTHDVAGSNLAHIHTAPPGVSGPANVVSLTQGVGVYTAPGVATITAQNLTDLLAGNTYFNVHSLPNFGAGEIRGQIAVQ